MSALDAIVSPLDDGRSAILRRFGGVLRPLIGDRGARTTVVFTLIVVVALVTTMTMPIALLALGPIAFGVPHVLADVRYLVVRPGLHRERGLWLVALPLLGATITSDLRIGLAAPVIAALLARGAIARKVLVVLLATTALVAACLVGRVADLVFVHAHNFIAVLIWWLYRPRRAREVVPLMLFVAASLALLFGVAEPVLHLTNGLGTRLPFHLGEVIDSIATGAPPALGLRLVLVYAFAQSVHYGVWLRLVPEDDRARRAPRSFAASLQALRADLGAPILVATSLAALG
ncbi:MAG: hypothetical protein ABI175_12445, partial [Polyangiales bacterium]